MNTLRRTFSWIALLPGRLVTGSARLFAALLAVISELMMSRRGLALLFRGVAAVLATAGWLRPPLSSDLRSFHVPLGAWEGDECNPAQLLDGPRRPIPLSAGGPVLGLILIGVLLVLWRPQCL